MQKKILLVEDERDICELVELHLRRAHYQVDIAYNGSEAFKLLNQNKYDLFILDWMLPEMNGLEITRMLRDKPPHKTTPILMLTARIDSKDVILGLETGADDYVTKPFDTNILMARVKSLLRRAQITNSDEKLKLGSLVLDLNSYEVFSNHSRLSLTLSEFKLLSALAKNQGRVLTREKLISLIQGEGVNVVDRTIDTHIFGLRKKLGKLATVIETVRGVGYRVRVEN